MNRDQLLKYVVVALVAGSLGVGVGGVVVNPIGEDEHEKRGHCARALFRAASRFTEHDALVQAWREEMERPEPEDPFALPEAPEFDAFAAAREAPR